MAIQILSVILAFGKHRYDNIHSTSVSSRGRKRRPQMSLNDKREMRKCRLVGISWPTEYIELVERVKVLDRRGHVTKAEDERSRKLSEIQVSWQSSKLMERRFDIVARTWYMYIYIYIYLSYFYVMEDCPIHGKSGGNAMIGLFDPCYFDQ